MAMWKVLIGLLVALLLVFALAGVGYVGTVKSDATPCERDCINDSGGINWCVSYCKEHGSYGPPKK
jgi:hypothetical protein